MVQIRGIPCCCREQIRERQRIGSIGDVADEGVDAFLVLDAPVLGDQVNPGTIKAQLDELDADDVEGSAIEITYDQDTGEVTDVQDVE